MTEESKWTMEEFLESVKDVNPAILDIHEKIHEALEESEAVEIDIGEATYSFMLPSTDYKSRMGVTADGRVMLGLEELSREEEERLASNFSNKLGIEIDLEENWSRVLELGKDLKAEYVKDFRDIILG